MVESVANRANKLLLIVFIVMLVIFRIPYLATGHIQEDAYIHFQHMRSLADTGVFGFNPGERVNGSTSPLYVLLYSPLFALVPSAAISVVQILNCLVLISAVIILAYTFYSNTRYIYIVILIAAITPPILLTSYAGMETSLLILCYAVLLFDLRKGGDTKYGTAAMIVLPFIRLDAIAFAGLFLLILFSSAPKQAIRRSIFYILSLGVLLVGYQLYFGNWLPETIIGKATSYGVGSLSIEDRLSGIYDAISVVMLPVSTKYLFFLKPVFFITLIGFCIWLLMHYRRTALCSAMVLLVAYITLTPAVYGASSVVFPWYLWPAAVLVYVILVGEFTTLVSRQKQSLRHLLIIIFGIICLGLASLQWVVSFDNGTQEFRYRRSIGLWISENRFEDESTSVMLEPIGYIGYHCECYVHDTVGLVSPLVTEYKRTYGDMWYFEYIGDERPTYLLLRESELNELQQKTEFTEGFESRYTLQHTFTYEPSKYFSEPILLRILEAGSDIPYLLFVRNDLVSSVVAQS